MESGEGVLISYGVIGGHRDEEIVVRGWGWDTGEFFGVLRGTVVGRVGERFMCYTRGDIERDEYDRDNAYVAAANGGPT